jgi:riboflavin kinase/FMN adenylyltransferase
MITINLTFENLAYYQKQTSKKVLALGNFDGLHLGHSKVIQEASEIAELKGEDLAVMSFSPHPRQVFEGEKSSFSYLLPIAEKKNLLESMGVDVFYVVEFTRKFGGLKPEEFIDEYMIGLGASHVVAGYDFKYGFKGEGTMAYIPYYTKGKLAATTVDKVAFKGEKISSTLIRSLINKGEFEKLEQLIGYTYGSFGSWDGRYIKFENDTAVPEEGIYYVTLQTNNRYSLGKHKVEMYMKEDNKRLICGKLPLLSPGTEIKVVWEKKENRKLLMYA